MIAATRGLFRALLASTAIGAVIVACASGNDVQDEPGGSGGSSGAGGFATGGAGGTSTGSGGGSTTTTTGLPPGEIGGPCNETADCKGGNCTQIGAAKYCTQACPPACPAGTYCAFVEGDALCVPDLGNQCGACNGVVDCKGASDACLTAPAGDKFCARDCTTQGDCPDGFTCVDGSQYGPGAPGGGAGGAGQGGGAFGGSGGAGQGGADHPSGQAWKYCVPKDGASCGCSAERDKVERSCQSPSQNGGSCTGTQSCDGATGQWSACSAPAPAPEQCNGKDDDCNGKIDDGDPATMCKGSPPPNTLGWACKGGECVPGECKQGFTSYPDADPKKGCSCQMELGEPNDACAQAYAVGKVTDQAGSSLTINGTLSSDGDVDVWTFDSKDLDEGSTNSYHLSIAFGLPVPNDEFVFDVVRGDACQDAPSGPAVSLTSYSWCVDGSDGDKQGEQSCGPAAAVHCQDHSSKYFVRVHRKAGAKGTCSLYQLKVMGAGGEACDFTKKCPPQ
jgi:hypothetical protein